MTRQPLPPDFGDAIATAAPDAAARIHFHAEVDSTNDLALDLAAAGAPHGTAVLADMQRQGRGRRGRSWCSPAGAGLYLSVVIRPCNWSGGLAFVTLGAGVAAARAVLATTGLAVELKWPNDLVVGRPWRKLGGVLSEAVGAGARADAVVVGLGVNVRAAAFPPELAGRATSLEIELGRAVDRGPLVRGVLAEIDRVAAMLWRGESDLILSEWREFGGAALGSAPVRWRDQRGWRSGAAVGLAPDGALVVEADGRRERIIAGEVLWQRMGE
jgi:BirA family biotin operon repressor/biotin-[acetyl-CoA-carboxylase] ligase